VSATIEVTPGKQGSANRSVRVPLRGSRTNSRAENRGGVPLSVPACQLYYWTARWQRDEAESLAELEAGDCVTFEGPDATNQALQWLFGDDE
jgi:hypothetical protein